jgi:hypothetical protein
MSVLRRARSLAVLAVLAVAGGLCAAHARAGVNTWTGSTPGVAAGAVGAVATDPRDPYVVYAVFGDGGAAFSGRDLYKSVDGGRTWTRLATFDVIYSLLVHPAAPDTLYVGAGVDLSSPQGYSNLFKSEDGGATWTRKPFSTFYEFTSVIVGSPTDPGLVYVGAGSRMFRTTDGGNSFVRTADIIGAISSLVIHPEDPSKLYAGTDGDGGYYYPFGAFAESSNTGGSWTYEGNLGVLNSVSVALDAANPSTLFLGLAAYTTNAEHGVRRSDDGGATWSHAENGLPEGTQVESVAVDPTSGATVYAATRAGIYRSRDSGANWVPFSQVLAGVHVHSLAFSADGRSVLAATERGAFAFEVTEGPVDVAATGGDASGVLSWSADRLAVQTLSGSGGWSASPFEGPVAAWHAVAAASSGDGRTHVLWQAGDGRSAVEVVGPAGRESAVVLADANSWMPVDISVGTDGATRLLFTRVDGAMYVGSLDASGIFTPGPPYGPAGGWSAIALAGAPDGGTRVLWRSIDGRSALSTHRAGVMEASFKWDASADGAVADVDVGADGKARILVADAAGEARIWTVAADGSRVSGGSLEIAGLAPRRIAAGTDGALRLLWADRSGHGTVAILDASGALVATHDVPALP